MLPKPRRPREKRIIPLGRATYSIAEFCDMTGLSRVAVLRSMDDGALHTVKIGNRRLILAQQPHMPSTWPSLIAAPARSETQGDGGGGCAVKTSARFRKRAMT